MCIFCLWPLLVCNAGTVRLFSGEAYEAKIELDNNGISVTRDKTPSIRLDLNNIVELVFGKSPATAPCPPGVLLVNGSYIPGTPPDMDEASVKIGNPAVTIPATSIARVIYAAMPFEKALQPSTGRTGVILANGDFFAGTFDGVKDKRSVVINSPFFGPQSFLKTIPFALVLRDVQNTPSRFEVIGKDKRFFVDDLKIDATGISCHDPIAGDIKVVTKDVLVIRAGSSRWQAIADLKPSSVDAPKGTDPANAVRVLPATEPPELEPVSLLTAAQASVSYAVPPGLGFFTCRVVLPKETTPETRFAFVVYGDGRVLSRSPFMGPGDVPQSFRVSLGLARVITLRVEPAKPVRQAMFGKWIDPMFLRP